ncbi:MAG TPA: trans-aconitate 2-methyltransferase [Dongiaceae bacterium]|nr:trans-aconitate 2-methyltransferase [Dongiaceae bacterium]
MPTWDPSQYLKFSDHRLRPALDLMAQIPLEGPRSIYDLGCGPGNITRMLAERWAGAAVAGIDSSADMLAKARREAPGVAFEQADIADWSPPAPADLVFSNATLHWLDDHASLLPRLASWLAPGGVLAIQMPYNRDSPSHLLMETAAADGPWRSRLSGVRQAYQSLEDVEVYYRILAPVTRQVDIWETTYLHVLEGDNPVVEWTKGTALRPYLDALDEAERAGFLAAYSRRIAAAYPKQPDGCTLLPFRRIFFIVRR